MEQRQPVIRWSLVTLLGIVGGVVIFLVSFASACVVEGTPVDTPDGPHRIETLRPGDEVWSVAPTGERCIGRVRAIHTSRSGAHLEISIQGGEMLRVTAAHPVAVRGGWRAAEGLSAGDAVRTRAGWRAVEAVKRVDGHVRVFDLEVEPHPNFFAAGVLVHNKQSVRGSNERNTEGHLRVLGRAQDNFHGNDRDRNRIQDFWVRDVAELHYMAVQDGQPIQLIEKSIADADADPLRPRKVEPKSGYYFAVVPLCEDGAPYAEDTDGDGTTDRNKTRFAICAWPAEYGITGTVTFLYDETDIIYGKDCGKGERIVRWPANLTEDGWRKMN